VELCEPRQESACSRVIKRLEPREWENFAIAFVPDGPKLIRQHSLAMTIECVFPRVEGVTDKLHELKLCNGPQRFVVRLCLYDDRGDVGLRRARRLFWCHLCKLLVCIYRSDRSVLPKFLAGKSQR